MTALVEVAKCPQCSGNLDQVGVSRCPYCQVALVWRIVGGMVTGIPRVPFAGDINSFTQTHRHLVDSFSLDELQLLCHSLGVNHEDLASHNQRPGLARELYLYMKRRSRLAILEKALKGELDD